MAETAPSTRRTDATLYVGGLDVAHVTSQTLSEAFIPFGEIVNVVLPKPELASSTDLHRGFGYVEFEDPVDAKEAIDNMDQSELYGRVIKVAIARPDSRRDADALNLKGQPTLGSATAIWEQEGYLAAQGVSLEDRRAVEEAGGKGEGEGEEDSMRGLEGLDVAGPRPA